MFCIGRSLEIRQISQTTTTGSQKIGTLPTCGRLLGTSIGNHQFVHFSSTRTSAAASLCCLLSRRLKVLGGVDINRHTIQHLCMSSWSVGNTLFFTATLFSLSRGADKRRNDTIRERIDKLREDCCFFSKKEMKLLYSPQQVYFSFISFHYADITCLFLADSFSFVSTFHSSLSLSYFLWPCNMMEFEQKNMVVSLFFC